MSPAPASSPDWRHRFAVLTAAATLALVCAGGLVTSHGVGMAVPDWPNTYGYNMFFFPFSRWVGGIFYEHTHRLVASGVGLLTTILAIWLYGYRSRPFLRYAGGVLCVLALVTGLGAHRQADAIVLGITGVAALVASFFWPATDAAPVWIRRLGLVAFFAVVIQGVLGGLRVVLFKDQIGIFHATLAQMFFALTCVLALVTSGWWRRQSEAANAAAFAVVGRARWFFIAATSLILLQLILGATMRHQHAGLSIPDFPLAYGKIWPAIDPSSVAHYNQQRVELTDANPITAFQIVLQMVHRLMALLILVAVSCAALVSRRQFGPSARCSRLSLVWAGLVLVQALLGAATIWTNKAADIATAHVLVGALLLAMGTLLTLLAYLEQSTRAAVQFANRNQSAVEHPFSPRPSTATSLE